MSLLLVQNMVGDLLMPDTNLRVFSTKIMMLFIGLFKTCWRQFWIGFLDYKQLYKIYHCDQFLQNGLEVYLKERLFYLQGIS